MAGKIITDDAVSTVAKLDLRVRQAASALRSADLSHRRIALLLRNDLAFVEVFESIRFAAAVPVPLNWHCTASEIAYILDDCGAGALVVHADLWRRFGPELPASLRQQITVFVVPTPPAIASAYQVEGEDVIRDEEVSLWNAFIDGHEPAEASVAGDSAPLIYTSGTTGRPKGVLRKGPVRPKPVGYDALFGSQTKTLMVAPLYHSAPNRIAFGTFQAGGTLVLPARFDAESTLRLIEQHQITTAFMVPTMFRRLLKLPEGVRRRWDLSSLTHVVTAGAPCPAWLKAELIEWWGPVIYEYYGSTETSALTFCSSSEARARPGTVGRALPFATVAVYDESGNRCPAGVSGEIYGGRSDLPDFTYLNREDAREEVGRDGLVTVGDIGFLDEDGYLFLSDRKSDMIISGGSNIYPAQVEAALLQHPAVLDCAVFGIPDEDLGEVVAAVIQAIEPIDDDALRKHLKSLVSTYMLPRRFRYSDRLPRDPNGKLRKGDLRESFRK
ncbi:MAG: AMP-binding protein [Myxococcota bacterium]